MVFRFSLQIQCSYQLIRVVARYEQVVGVVAVFRRKEEEIKLLYATHVPHAFLRERERERERQIDRQRERHTHTHRQRERASERASARES